MLGVAFPELFFLQVPQEGHVGVRVCRGGGRGVCVCV